MRIIIAGSRGAAYKDVIKAITTSPFELDDDDIILCGGAEGADAHGKDWAQAAGLEVWDFPANWDRYGKAAGPVRNEEMAKHADGLIAVWDGKSKGTLHMINTAHKRGLFIHVYTYHGRD